MSLGPSYWDDGAGTHEVLVDFPMEEFVTLCGTPADGGTVYVMKPGFPPPGRRCVHCVEERERRDGMARPTERLHR